MSIVFSTRPQVQKIVPIAGSNKPLYKDTMHIKGKGVFQKDLLSRKLYSGGKDVVPIVAPITNEIPFQPVTQLGKSQQFAIDFFKGKAIYDQRKTFSDNLSTGNNNDPIYHSQEVMMNNPNMPPQLAVSNRRIGSLGSFPPPSIKPLNLAIDTAAAHNMSSEGYVEPMDILHQNIPPALRQLRSPTISTVNSPMSVSSMQSPTQSITPVQPNVTQYLDNHANDFIADDRVGPSAITTPTPKKNINGWAAEYENSQHVSDKAAALHIDFVNLTNRLPEVPRKELGTPIIGTSNLQHDRNQIPGGFPTASFTFVAPNLSAIPQATEYHLGTPINQQLSRQNNLNSRESPNSGPHSSPINNPMSRDSIHHNQANDTNVSDLFNRRRQEMNRKDENVMANERAIAEPRRSKRTRMQPNRLGYDANFNQGSSSSSHHPYARPPPKGKKVEEKIIVKDRKGKGKEVAAIVVPAAVPSQATETLQAPPLAESVLSKRQRSNSDVNERTQKVVKTVQSTSLPSTSLPTPQVSFMAEETPAVVPQALAAQGPRRSARIAGRQPTPARVARPTTPAEPRRSTRTRRAPERYGF